MRPGSKVKPFASTLDTDAGTDMLEAGPAAAIRPPSSTISTPSSIASGERPSSSRTPTNALAVAAAADCDEGTLNAAALRPRPPSQASRSSRACEFSQSVNQSIDLLGGVVV